MKKMTTAVALSSLSSTVLAQSQVTVYGSIDAGIQSINNAPQVVSRTQSASLIRLESGKWAGPRIGLHGTEDLGGGIAAIFVLENGFSAIIEHDMSHSANS